MELSPATLNNSAQITALYREAFPPEEAELVGQLAVDLLNSTDAISVVAIDNGLVGHIAFSPLTLTEHPNYRALILAPLAVDPRFQKQGIGSKLVEHSLAHHKESAVHDIYVYGDPNYYSRFGFIEASTEQIEVPYPLSYPFGWQRLQLNEHPVVSGMLSCVEALQKPELW